MLTNSRARSRWRVVPSVGAFTLALGSLLASACGSKTAEEPQAKAGSAGSTAESAGSPSTTAGSAGAMSQNQCAAGDTRICVGPGACAGGQVCGSDRQWSACDCGGGGSGGRPNGGGGGAGGGGADSGAEGGASGDAGVGGLGDGDEACPKGAIALDCSGQCGPVSPLCPTECAKVVHVDTAAIGTVVARLPPHPAMDCNCGSPGSVNATYAVSFIIDHPPSAAYHITLPEPWSFEVGAFTPCVPPYGAQCRNSTAYASFPIRTADPSAVAVNLTLEPGNCP